MCRGGFPKGPVDSFAPRQATFKSGKGKSKSSPCSPNNSRNGRACVESCSGDGKVDNAARGKRQACVDSAYSSSSGGGLLDSTCGSEFTPRRRRRKWTDKLDVPSTSDTPATGKGPGRGSGGTKTCGSRPTGQQVKINSVLDAFGLVLVPKEKDGNCFYHCLADELGIDAMEVRSQIGVFVTTSGERALVEDFNMIFYDDFSFRDLVRDVTRPGGWGGQHEMALAQHIFGREIIVFDIRETTNCPIAVTLFAPDRKLKSSFDFNSPGDLLKLKDTTATFENPIFLLRVNTNHFDLLKRIEACLEP